MKSIFIWLPLNCIVAALNFILYILGGNPWNLGCGIFSAAVSVLVFLALLEEKAKK